MQLPTKENTFHCGHFSSNCFFC